MNAEWRPPGGPGGRRMSEEEPPPARPKPGGKRNGVSIRHVRARVKFLDWRYLMSRSVPAKPRRVAPMPVGTASGAGGFSGSGAAVGQP